MFNDSSGFLSFAEKFNDAFDKISPIIVSNILWVLLCIPIITAFPATAGMFYVTNQSIHGKPAGVRVFFEGFRRYFWVSLLWGLINIIAGLLFYANIWFYGNMTSNLGIYLEYVFRVIVMIWVIVQFFTLPFLIEQVENNLLQAMRNSLAGVGVRPLQNMGLFVLAIVVAVFCTLIFRLGWLLFGGGLISYLANRGVLNTILVVRKNQARGQVKTKGNKPQITDDDEKSKETNSKSY